MGTAAGFFTIPPGYASPIWPAAGWAVLCCLRYGWRALLGIFLASFLLNLQFSNASLFQFSSARWVAGSIALGAVGQAFIASCCAHRFALTRHAKIVTVNPVKLALIIGPAACLLSPTVGVSTLVVSGVMPAGSTLLNWLHWWVGDSIGAMAFAPFIALMKLAGRWAAPKRAFVFLGCYILLIAVVSLVFVQSRVAEEHRVKALFEEEVEGAHQSVLKQLQAISFAGRSLASLFEVFPSVSYSQFESYASGVYDYIPGSQGISWVPFVAHGDRAVYEAEMSEDLGESYSFREVGQAGMMAAEARPAYYPVHYIYPFESNRRASGFDLGSHPDRLKAIEYARQTKEFVITAPITLVQEEAEQRAFLLFTPVMEDGVVTSLVSSVYRAGDLLLVGVPEDVMASISIFIQDTTEPENIQLLYGTEPTHVIYDVVRKVAFAGREWTLSYAAGPGYVGEQQTNGVWLVLIVGFIVVIVFGLFILQILNSHSLIRQEVMIKTLALENALEEAREANRVKTNFLACMSHELRTPLNSIIGFSVRCLKILPTDSDAKLKNALTVIERNGHHLLSLINDVLDLAKVEAGKMTIKKARVDVAVAVQEVLVTLQPLVGDKPVELTTEPPPVEYFMADKQRLQQILINLGANAINHTHAGEVHIGYALLTHTVKGREQGADGRVKGLQINMRDTGVGITQDNLLKVFNHFEQVGDQISPGNLGTGLGLALVQEFVSLHGGEVSVSSEVGVGSVFSVWLPLE